MQTFTKPNNQFSLFKFSSFIVLLFTLFCNLQSYAQNPSGIAINWSTEAACQTYSVKDDAHYTEPVFIEAIENGQCRKVCNKSKVTYTLSGNLGTNPATLWNVAGGLITFENTTECIVEWGEPGQGSISFTIDTPNGVITKTICIEKIIIPIANFALVPYPDYKEEVSFCSKQILYFTNLSSPNNGAGINSYQWDFGDLTPTSTVFSPTHIYNQPGSYIVTLIVTNSCGCSSQKSIKIDIYDKGFDINCPGVVCEGQTINYTTNFDNFKDCTNPNYWTVIGGQATTLLNGSVDVNWNNVDDLGFGYVTFNPQSCGLACLQPTTIKVPIIKSKCTILGNETLCLGTQGRYVLPQWPTTDFQWEILGNGNNTLALVIPTDQRNEVIIQPLSSGNLILKCVYQNTLLHCGGLALFNIKVGKAYEITGTDVLCQNESTTYTLPPNILATWILKNNAGSVVGTPLTNSNSFTYTFNATGNYFLYVSGNGICSNKNKIINVVAIPVAPLVAPVAVVANGDYSVCPNVTYNYKVTNPEAGYQYRWVITNGSCVGSNIGTQVAIIFNNVPSMTIKVFKESTNPMVCVSLPTTLTVLLKTLPVALSINNGFMCANTIGTYSAVKAGVNPEIPFTDGETYEWSIWNATGTALLPNAGTISSGQGTNTISVLWNNLVGNNPQSLTVTLKLVIGKCTLYLTSRTFSKTIVINPVPIIQITAPVSTVCSGTPVVFTISSTNGVPINPTTLISWNVNGTIETLAGNTTSPTFTYTYIFNNIGTNSIIRNVTAFLITPNGCSSNSNTFTLPITISPQPPANLSFSNANGFCPPQQINTLLSAGTLTAGTTIQWYKQVGASIFTLAGQTSGTLQLDNSTAYGYGSYYFIATNTFGCSKKSNVVVVSQVCVTPACIPPSYTLTNTSYSGCSPTPSTTPCNSCNSIKLIGTASPVPTNTFWTIIGPSNPSINPTVTSTNTTTTSLATIPVVAGLYKTFFNAVYTCSDGTNAIVTNPVRDVIVPYTSDFAYAAVCNAQNNGFTLNITDKSTFLTGTSTPTFAYYFSSSPTGPWGTAVATTASATNIPHSAGNFYIRLVIQATYQGVLQTPCEKIISIALASTPVPVPKIVNPALCYDTPVKFGFSSQIQNGDIYLWTLEPGVENTQLEPVRVFTTPGVKTVSVVVTNKYGCSSAPVTVQVTIPPKCFNGIITATPAPPTVCLGTPVTLHYEPNNDLCTSGATYTWFNGLTQIGVPTTAPFKVVTSPGAYWVKVTSSSPNLCVYDTPNRVTPSFKNLPAVTLITPSSVCIGSDIPVKAVTTATTISWTSNNGSSTTALPAYTNLNSFTLPAQPAGTYTITATVTENGCTATASQQVTVASTPTVTIEPPVINCNPYSVTLTANSSAGSSVTWNNGMTGNTITVNDGGPYQARASVGECNTTAQIVVPRNPEDYMWIFPYGCVTQCRTKDLLGFLIGPYVPLNSWEWFNNNLSLNAGTGFTLPQPLATTGSYTSTIDTSAGCTATSQPLSYTVNECAECQLNATFVNAVYNGDKFCMYSVNLTITNGGSLSPLLLSAPNNDVIFTPASLVTVAGTTSYTITAIPLSNFAGGVVVLNLSYTKDGVTCSTFVNISLPSCNQINSKAINTSAAAFSGSKAIIKMYPNPAKDQVIIQYSSLQNNATVEVFDITGRSMYKQPIVGKEGTLQLTTSNYPAGIYIVVAKEDNTIVTQQKLIIE